MTPLGTYYPGDDYVDFVTISVYNLGTSTTPWKSFYTILKPYYDELVEANIKRPFAIGETNIEDFGGTRLPEKEQWYHDALYDIVNYFPRITHVTFFFSNSYGEQLSLTTQAEKDAFKLAFWTSKYGKQIPLLRNESDLDINVNYCRDGQLEGIGWSQSGANQGVLSFSTTGTPPEALQGSGVLNITDSGNPARFNYDNQVFCTTTRQLEVNKQYAISFWAKGSVDGMVMDIGVAKSSSPQTTYIRKQLPLSTNWKFYEIPIALDTVAYANNWKAPVIFLGKNLVAGTVSLSQIMINKGDHSKPFTNFVSTQTLQIFSKDMIPALTNGSGTLTQAETTTHAVNYMGLPFDASAIEFASFSLVTPQNWNAGTIRAKFLWTTTGGASGNVVRWRVQGRTLADGEAIDQSQPSSQSVNDTWQADGSLHISDWSPAVTLTGAGAGEIANFRVSREATHFNDTLTTDAILLGVLIEYRAV
jgi:hypothetical protein